ncbi:MAG: lysophospholipid acyltransferase family protein [Oligoflexus sp.]
MASVIALARLFLLCVLGLSLYLSATVLYLLLKLLWQDRKMSQQMLCKARLASFHFRLILRCCNIKLAYESQSFQNLPMQRALFLANHVNYFDILALSTLHPMGFIAKEEVGNWPILGNLVKFFNTILVKREDAISRFRCIRQLQKGVVDLCYTIFPQGTTSLMPYISQYPWYAGQLFCLRDPQVRVFAVGLRYERHECMAWIDSMTLLPHLWKALKLKQIVIGVALKEIKIVEASQISSIRQHSEQIRQTINQLGEEADALIAAFTAGQSAPWEYPIGSGS